MSIPRAPRTSILLAAAGLAAFAVPESRFAAASAGPVPNGGHAEVIAQSLVAFGGGEYSWEMATLSITETAPTSMTADPLTFVIGDGPAAAVATPTSGDSGGARLAAGEAIAVHPDAGLDVIADAPEGGAIVGIAIASGPGDGTFTPGAGRRDVDLVRDVLNPNEALIVDADVSAFVVVTAGALDAAGTPIADGSGVAMEGTITLINTSPDMATVLVAVVGRAIGDATAPSPPPPTPATPTGTDGSGDGGSGGGGGGNTTTTTTTTPPTTAVTTTTTTEPPAPVDTDSDGLTDAEEAGLGTDPNSQDSDGDGIPDGREVNALGSNPLDTDTDSDGLTDALEVDHSCNVNVPDTDGDGLGDAFEANSGFSECALADTDGDGDDDQAEFSLGTDPRDPNCFSGPGSVCQN